MTSIELGADDLRVVIGGLTRTEALALPALALVAVGARAANQWCITGERNSTAWGHFVCQGKHPPEKKP